MENSIGNLSAFYHMYNAYRSLSAKVGKPDVMILAGLQNQITNYRYEKNAKRYENVSQRSDSQWWPSVRRPTIRPTTRIVGTIIV